MDFFGIGLLELVLILILALVILGPDKLPAAGRQLGKGIRELRKAASEFMREITEEKHGPEAAEKSKSRSQS